MSMVDAVFAGIALAFWAAVWAMRPSKGAEPYSDKDAPLDRTPARKGEAR